MKTVHHIVFVIILSIISVSCNNNRNNPEKDSIEDSVLLSLLQNDYQMFAHQSPKGTPDEYILIWNRPRFFAIMNTLIGVGLISSWTIKGDTLITAPQIQLLNSRKVISTSPPITVIDESNPLGWSTGDSIMPYTNAPTKYLMTRNELIGIDATRPEPEYFDMKNISPDITPAECNTHYILVDRPERQIRISDYSDTLKLNTTVCKGG